MWIGNDDIGFVRVASARDARTRVYKALVRPHQMVLVQERERLALGAGMQFSAEIWLGERSVLEYLLSPVCRAWREAGRER